MRLLHVITGLGTGGAERFLAALAPRLAARGFDQRVVSVTSLESMAGQLEKDGIPVVALGVKSPLKASVGIARLANIIRSFAPHAIQGWMYHGDLLATIAKGLSGSRQSQLYWGIRCSDMKLTDYAPQLRFVVRACAWLSTWPDLVVANSEVGAKVHVDAGYKPRAWAVIPNGIDTGRFRPDADHRREIRAALGVASDTPLVVHVARVDPMKDHRTMTAAAAELDGRAVTVLVGKDTQMYALSPGIIALGARSDIERVLAAGDLIVSSSAYGEGFSNAIAEGMAAGLVPIATDVGDARAIVGDTGVIVRPRSSADLAEAIRATLAAGPAACAARGAAARERIITEFSLERATDRFEAAYRDALGTRRSGSRTLQSVR